METGTYQKAHFAAAISTGPSPTAAIATHSASALATCDGCG